MRKSRFPRVPGAKWNNSRLNTSWGQTARGLLVEQGWARGSEQLSVRASYWIGTNGQGTLSPWSLVWCCCLMPVWLSLYQRSNTTELDKGQRLQGTQWHEPHFEASCLKATSCMELYQGWISCFSMNTSHGFATRLETILLHPQPQPNSTE